MTRLCGTSRARALAGVLLALPLLLCLARPATALVEAYGTFECMGVVADVPAGHTAAEIGRVKVYIDRGGTWEPVQDAVQCGSTTMFATSVFGLTPGTSYNFKIEFCNGSGTVIDTQNVSGSTRPEEQIPAPANELYVSTTGDDDNAGTIGAPYETLTKALSVATPGTHIYMRGGTYYEGDIMQSADGTAEAPIVIKAYQSETPVLDGADPSLISTTWTQVSPQVYRHACTLDPRNVSLRKKSSGEVYRAYRMGTAAEVQSATSTFDGATRTFAYLSIDAAYNADGANITIRVPSGTIGDYDVYVSKLNTGILFDGANYIKLYNLTFTHFGNGDFSRALYLNDSSDITVSACDFRYNNVGVWLKRASSRVVVEDCNGVDDTADWHFGYTKSAGVFYHGEVETGLVTISGPYSGRGVVIRRNTIQGLFDGCGIGPSSYTGARTAEVDFYDNTLTHLADDVTELDGYVRNYRYFNNYARGSLSGISLAQALDGPVWIVRNRITDAGICKATALEEYEGYPFKTNGGDGTAVGSGQVFFYNNTAYTSDPASSAMLVKGNDLSPVIWKKFTFRNNIWCGKARGFLAWRQTISPMDWDYDDLYTASGPFIQLGNRGDTNQNTYYDTPAEAFAAKGWLEHGISAAPQFTNAAGGDFSLTSSSPCRNAGVVLPNISDGFQGSAPDMGAIEYGEASGQAAKPAFAPPAGTFGAPVDVTITSATGGAEIRYTTDGSDPSASSALYGGPLHIAATSTLKAKAFADGYTASAVETGLYTITGTVAAPAFDPPAGRYNAAVDVAIASATTDAQIHYTTNGSTPTSASTTYTTPVHVAATTTLKAIAVVGGLPDSAVTTGAYTIDAAAPAVSSVAALPTSVRQGIDLTLAVTATADDGATGGSTIIAAECYTNAATPAGSGTAMTASDGAFSSASENVSGTLDCSSWPTGQRTVYVRARDAAGNWSVAASTLVNVLSSTPPAAVTTLSARVHNIYTVATITVTASSTLPASSASSLSDGSALTCWQSAGTATAQEEWVMADLGQTKSVGAVSLVAGTLPKYFPSVFVIETSENGTDWISVAKADRAKAAAKARYIWEFIPQDARYIRVRGLSTGGRTGSLYDRQLGEIEVPTSLSSSRLNLTWTAVADDGTTGQPAMEYDIRYSSVAISAANFAAATPVTGAPAPGTPGAQETATVDLGSYVGRVFVAMKVKDASENYSALSNVVTLRVGGIRMVSSYPDDGYNATAGSLPMFSFATGGDLKPVILTFASTDGFPATPIIMGDKTKKYTMKLGTALGATSLKVSAAQWKAIKATATQEDVVFWRLEGKAKVNGTTATVYGPTRGMYFDIGTISGLTVAGAHTVDGKDALYPALTPLPQFSWTNNSKGMVKFFVDVSTDPDVPLSDRKATAVLGGKGVTGASYTLTAADWKRVRKLAGGTPDGVIYWRARGVDRDNVLDCGSAIKPLLIDSGTWDLSDMAHPAESGVVSWTTSATGLVKFYVEFSSESDFPILTRQTVRVPLAGVAGASYALTAADIKKIALLATNNEVTTLYYRVRAEDADKSFVGHSQAKTTTAP